MGGLFEAEITFFSCSMLELPPLTALQMSFVTIHKYILRVLASVLNSLLRRLLDLERRVNWSSYCSPPPPSWNWLCLTLSSSKNRHTSDSQEEEEEGAEKAGNPWNRTFQTLLRCHLNWGYGILESGKPEFLTARCLWWYYDNDVDIDDVDIDDNDGDNVNLEMHKSHCL